MTNDNFLIPFLIIVLLQRIHRGLIINQQCCVQLGNPKLSPKYSVCVSVYHTAPIGCIPWLNLKAYL